RSTGAVREEDWEVDTVEPPPGRLGASLRLEENGDQWDCYEERDEISVPEGRISVRTITVPILLRYFEPLRLHSGHLSVPRNHTGHYFQAICTALSLMDSVLGLYSAYIR